MKEKILARLKALFSGLNLSTARLDAIADKLATKITDENQIDARLNELNEISPFSDIAKYDDWQRSKEAKEKTDREKADREKADKEKADREKADKEKPANGQTPDISQLIRDAVQPLFDKIAALESGKKAESHNSTLLTLVKDKVPESFYKLAIRGRTFKDDAEVTEFGNSLVEEYGKYHQEQVDKGLAVIPKPASGSGGADSAKEVTADMKDYLAKKKEQRELVQKPV